MADEAPLGPQPNFDLISDEIKKSQNLPSITNGQQILVEIRALRQDLLTMILTSNHNDSARVQNTYVESQTDRLTRFLNPTDGTAIQHFPNTSAELGEMHGRQLSSVLQQLGLQPADGMTVAERKKMFRRHIGLREVAGQAPP